MRRQRGFHAHGARAMSVDVCCALLRFGGADHGRRSRVPAPREQSAGKRTHAPSASIGCDHPGCGMFPERPSSGAQELKIQGRCLAPRIISHRGNGSSATSEAARKSLCLDCVTECRSGARPHKHESAWRCAYHVQRARLLCKSRGKTGPYPNAGEAASRVLHIS